MEEKHKLTAYEKETHINFSQEDTFASIYTYCPSLIRQLDKYVKEFPDKIQLTDVHYQGGKTYSTLKQFIKVKIPKTKNLSEERRQELRERMKNIRSIKE